MSGERYFLETWVRGSDATPFREINSPDSTREHHPHITFVRPFEIPVGQEDVIREKIVSFCSGRKPIKYVLEGKGSFGDQVTFVPVESHELSDFDRGLEMLLQSGVRFGEKLDDKKILHLTLKAKIGNVPRTESVMLRLTCLRDKKIWFSFDFVTQTVLNREDSLDEKRWEETLKIFHESLQIQGHC